MPQRDTEKGRRINRGAEVEHRKGETLENVEQWGGEVEQRIEQADTEILSLTHHLEESAMEKENHKRESELKFEKLKLEQKAKLESATIKQSLKSNVKLPKLIITKYDGTYEKWLSFWNKFEAEIDASELLAVTKFAHLKELLEGHICESIDGLPFNSEGYERAKNILKTNYGNTSEIIRAYIYIINSLPVITGSQPNLWVYFGDLEEFENLKTLHIYFQFNR